MADASISINNLQIEGKTVSCTVDFTGPPEANGSTSLYIYDATGAIVRSDDLEDKPLGQIHQHSLNYDLPESALADGDYAVWIFCWIMTSQDIDIQTLAEAKEGASFIVARGKVFKTAEEAHLPESANTVEIKNLRLEGTLVVFDMVNAAAHDVSVDHNILISTNDAATTVHEANGREIVYANATQQGHYPLPEPMADGRYNVWVNVGAESSQTTDFLDLNLEVRDGTIVVVP